MSAPLAAFASALLLFTLQPLLGRLALPRFGGGPLVWSAALLAFQTLLLAGYLYAHALARRALTPWRLALHAAVLLAPLALGPPGLPAVELDVRHPVPALLRALLLGAGPAFFALSTSVGLLQAAHTRLTGAGPSRVVAGSNAGSLAALVLYPLALEPRLALSLQARLFQGGYALVALGVLAVLARSLSLPAMPEEAAAEPSSLRAWARPAVLSAVSSALLTAVTARLAQEVASVPLLWAAPLALYLLSWVLAWGPLAAMPRAWLLAPTVYLVAFALDVWPFRYITATSWALGPPLALLLLGGLLLHGEVARSELARTHPSGLLLATALGGALGSLAVGLLAPLAFRTVAEYPLALGALALALAPSGSRPTRGELSVGALALALVVLAERTQGSAQGSARLLLHLVPAGALLGALARWRSPWGYALLVAAVALPQAAGLDVEGRVVARARSYFGALEVRDAGDLRTLLHGNTMHGAQSLARPGAPPGAYYHPSAPLGAAVQAARDGARVGVVGLGAGSLAALLRPGQSLLFFELDPAVEPLAREHFRFLSGSRGSVRVVHGDARLTLARVPAASLDVLVLDAFTSDAVPVHLLTREAFGVYLRALAPEGVLLVHASQRHLALERVLAGSALSLGLSARVARYRPDALERRDGARPSAVVALCRRAEPLASLPGPWRELREARPVEWTDERSSLLDALWE